MNTWAIIELPGNLNARHGNEPPIRTTAPVTLADVLAPGNVRSAWSRVRGNQGCAGVDGVSIPELGNRFDQEWTRVECTIRSGQYQCRPVLRIRIPKPSGGERLLGIPTVMDRVVQQSILQVLSKVWEPRFSDRNFAYRPGRGTRNALAALERGVDCGGKWILHLDIENFFDSVPHAITLSSLGEGIADEEVISLIQRTLVCGFYESGFVRATAAGLAQGSPLSPLLANIVLHRLDCCLESAGYEFARYADDCVLFLPRQELGTHARQLVAETLDCLGLKLNERKTTFGHFTSARFLGFAFRSDECGRTVRVISPEALADAEASLLKHLQFATGNAGEVSSSLAAMLRSWLAYFYTPHEEGPLRSLVTRIGVAWQEKFAGHVLPRCLRWEALNRGGPSGDHVDYCGHFVKAAPAGGSFDWAGSLHHLLAGLLRAKRWHLEYNLRWNRPPSARLHLGRHRINLRF